jgi:hypothetical protein
MKGDPGHKIWKDRLTPALCGFAVVHIGKCMGHIVLGIIHDFSGGLGTYPLQIRENYVYLYFKYQY